MASNVTPIRPRYRPSNDTEGARFMGSFCDYCENDRAFREDPDRGKSCDILARILHYDLKDPEYPFEWTYDDDGQPTCTALQKELTRDKPMLCPPSPAAPTLSTCFRRMQMSSPIQMVRALLEGRKTQARVVMKPQPGNDIDNLGDGKNIVSEGNCITCPFSVGELIWLREQLRCTYSNGVWYAADETNDEIERTNYLSDPRAEELADHYGNRLLDNEVRRIPSICMPRWASRLTLKITDARAEGLQDISEDDAVAEGLRVVKEDDAILWYSGLATEDWGGWSELWQPDDPVAAYRDLWESINGNWDENPWVWVLEFEVIQANVDHVLGQAA